MTFEQMKELIQLVAANRLGGVEVRDGEFHFRVSATAEGGNPGPALVAAPAEAVAAAAALAPAPEAEPEPEGHVLSSPIVGTFYAAPSPDAEPYVQVGDRVKKGQVICIVEAMKLMNEIESDVSGVVVKILAENAQPVEFGEPLFCIETD
ncbi:MAG: acetyl-CoA carboxylase biotin carboxyl carrier protein [Thermoanaerobaculia bacterium]|nr:acetyl-CoA carboxylase biotin carboxyl carrier protein [Thermoanaerobaculia bacterium]